MLIWWLGRVAIPLTFLGVLVVEALLTLGILEGLATRLAGGPLVIGMTAAVGTLLMIPSFTEIPLALGFLQAGLGPGPAAAILITAPAVSFPSLLIVGWAVRDHRVALVLGAMIFALGFLGGMTLFWMAG